MSFPVEYPLLPPEMRFVTPILHCNINAHGKICKSAVYVHVFLVHLQIIRSTR